MSRGPAEAYEWRGPTRTRDDQAVTRREDVSAGAVLVAALEPRSGPVLVKGARWAHYLLSEMLGGLLPPPSLTELVVRQILDDEVVLSLPAGDLPASEQLLGYVKNQLIELTLEEFLARWSEAPDHAGPQR